MVNDYKEFWAELNRMAGRGIKNAIVSCIGLDNGKITTDPKEIVDKFTAEYKALGEDIIPEGATFSRENRHRVNARVTQIRQSERLSVSGIKGFRLTGTCTATCTATVARGAQHHKQGENPGCLNRAVTVEEIKAAIAKQKNKAPSPLDGITNDMLVAGGDTVPEALVILFNLILDSGRCPKNWQTAVVTVTPKSGDLTDWANYRLISLLSIVGKLWEIVLASRISAHLEYHGLLSETQGGFRPGRSCQDQQFILAETIKARARENKNTYVAFLDIRKAYPTMARTA